MTLPFEVMAAVEAGLTLRRQQIQESIELLTRAMHPVQRPMKRQKRTPVEVQEERPKRTMSAAARKRISIAAKARFAAKRAAA